MCLKTLFQLYVHHEIIKKKITFKSYSWVIQLYNIYICMKINFLEINSIIIIAL